MGTLRTNICCQRRPLALVSWASPSPSLESQPSRLLVSVGPDNLPARQHVPINRRQQRIALGGNGQAQRGIERIDRDRIVVGSSRVRTQARVAELTDVIRALSRQSRTDFSCIRRQIKSQPVTEVMPVQVT